MLMSLVQRRAGDRSVTGEAVSGRPDAPHDFVDR